MRIDLNSDLGESFGPWPMGDDAAILDVVTSANVACGGHAGDPATMVETLSLARERGVIAGARPKSRTVIFELEDFEIAKAFWDSREYNAARALRIDAADGDFILMEGAD
jgi:hypothetical protein